MSGLMACATLQRLAVLLALLLTVSRSSAILPSLQAEPGAADWNVSLTIDLSAHRPIPSTLFGIFFEEIGHSGDGGIYSELVQDRSFDAIAAASGFAAAAGRDGQGSPRQQEVDLHALAASHRRATDPVPHSWEGDAGATYRSKRDYLHRRSASKSSNDIIIAWHALPGTTTTLSRSVPLNEHNPVAMELTAAQPTDAHTGRAGIVNDGYWGINLVKGAGYFLSMYIRNPQANAHPVTVAMISADLATTHGEFKLTAVGGGQWARYEGQAVSSASDTDARLAIMFDGPATLVIDSVSLVPLENAAAGTALGHQNPWPFRADLLQALKDLRPAFLRFPGGCYVEGDWMSNAFRWKKALGPNEKRPGHMNGVWGYWSTDGLGLFEYMLLVEELQTEPVWVINNGVAHGDSVRAADVMPLVQDALDSIEFITGSANTSLGAVRAAMGHPQPWSLTYMAIGNEDCGKPWYTENYNLFFGAISARYPHMRLISNCDMGDGAPTDLWDWHVYTNPQQLFDLRHAFDGRDPAAGHLIFASEYAVTDGGGWGNLIGAVAEAAFMTGLERNAQAVPLAAYAPLLVHWNDRPWPTNMLVFDNHRHFGIPSYHVQRLFRETQGTHYVDTQVANNPASLVHQDTVAASATCQDADCTTLVVKIVNFASYAQVVSLQLQGGGGVQVDSHGEMVVITSQHPEDENSFEDPLKVAPVGGAVTGFSNRFKLLVHAFSVNAVQLHLAAQPAGAAQE